MLAMLHYHSQLDETELGSIHPLTQTFYVYNISLTL